MKLNWKLYRGCWEARTESFKYVIHVRYSGNIRNLVYTCIAYNKHTRHVLKLDCASKGQAKKTAEEHYMRSAPFVEILMLSLEQNA